MKEYRPAKKRMAVSENSRRPIGLLLSAIWLIVLSALPPAFAGQKLSVTSAGDLVLEMRVHGDNISRNYVPAIGITWAEFFEFKRLADWRRPPDQTSDVGAIHMDYRRLGDAVIIDVDVIFGPVDLSGSQPVDAARIKSAGSYVIRVGESGSLQELARFGIEPIQVRVVSARLLTLNLADIANRTKAIEVVRVYQAMEICLVMLKNISAKNIVGLQLNYVAGSIQTGELIAPGQVYKAALSIPEAYLNPAPGKAQDKQVSLKLVVSSVLFEDSTYEGDLAPALTFMTRRRGVRVQAIRIVSLLQAALENPEHDSGRAMESLRRQLTALSDAADIQLIEDLARRFGPFTTYQRNGLLAALKDGLRDTKEGMLIRTRDYEKREAPKGTSLQSWLRTVKSYYEEKIKKL